MQCSSVELRHAAATDVVLNRHHTYPSSAARGEKPLPVTLTNVPPFDRAAARLKRAERNRRLVLKVNARRAVILTVRAHLHSHVPRDGNHRRRALEPTK